MPAKIKNGTSSSVASRLIDTAEYLYGRHGMDGVSLRQISSSAGTSNNYAVQYHFGNKAGLIRAILEARLPAVEAKTAELFSKYETENRLMETAALINIIYRPLIEHRNEKGERNCARFILALIRKPDELAGSMFHPGQMATAVKALELLVKANPEIPSALLFERLRQITFMVLAGIFNRVEPFNKDQFDAALIDNVLAMASAALRAPVDDSVQKMLNKVGSPRRKS